MALLSDPITIGKTHLPHRLILAPMCGITLKPFRKICKSYGAGLVFDQMVSARALQMQDAKSFKLMEFDDDERPVGLQLFGNNPESLAEAAKIMATLNPDVIDLNLGCPAKKIVSDGGGSALLQDEIKLADILKKMRRAIPGTFTIKIRAGWDEKSKNALSVAKIAEQEGIDAIAIHARTRAQGYSGKSDWAFIRHLKENTKIPVIGNGDIKTSEDAERMLQETNCDAVMTGRGAFSTPWIFEKAATGTQRIINAPERLDLILKQYDFARNYHGDAGGIRMMRKHLMAYTKGFRGGAELRSSIVRLTNFDEISNRLKIFFTHAEIDFSENDHEINDLSEI